VLPLLVQSLTPPFRRRTISTLAELIGESHLPECGAERACVHTRSDTTVKKRQLSDGCMSQHDTAKTLNRNDCRNDAEMTLEILKINSQEFSQVFSLLFLQLLALTQFPSFTAAHPNQAITYLT